MFREHHVELLNFRSVLLLFAPLLTVALQTRVSQVLRSLQVSLIGFCLFLSSITEHLLKDMSFVQPLILVLRKI